MKDRVDNMWQKQPRSKTVNGFGQKFDEPLSKKPVSVRIPISAMDILDQMPREERLEFVRNALCDAIALKQKQTYSVGGGAGNSDSG